MDDWYLDVSPELRGGRPCLAAGPLLIEMPRADIEAIVAQYKADTEGLEGAFYKLEDVEEELEDAEASNRRLRRENRRLRGLLKDAGVAFEEEEEEEDS
jgi:hypothetical protein